MSKFEFNNQLHYKSKDDIPITFGNTKSNASETAGSSSQLEDLAKIVFAIGDVLDNSGVSDQISKYKSKF